MARKLRKVQEERTLDKSEFCPDFEKSAAEYIHVFFHSLKSPDGKRFLKSELLDDVNIRTVMKTQFDDNCFDFIHSECLPLIPNSVGYHNRTVPWTVHCLLGLIYLFGEFGIPKEFQPGMLLLYFKLCFGVRIPPPPLI